MGIDDVENYQLNFSSIQMDEGTGFIQRWICTKIWNREKEIHQRGECQRTFEN